MQVDALPSGMVEKSQKNSLINVPSWKKAARLIRSSERPREESLLKRFSPIKIVLAKKEKIEGNGQTTAIVRKSNVRKMLSPINGKFTIPNGYRLQDVPGDGLCGYWAILTAKKAMEEGMATQILVTKREVFDLLWRLSEQIDCAIKKENKTDVEIERANEIDQLIRDGYAKNYGDLCEKIKKGWMQFDSPLAIFLAREIGSDIVLEWNGTAGKKNCHGREVYRTDDADGSITIYYSGNGSCGHYGAIIPAKINVVYGRGT
jgi:hypothetical protein